MSSRLDGDVWRQTSLSRLGKFPRSSRLVGSETNAQFQAAAFLVAAKQSATKAYPDGKVKEMHCSSTPNL